MTYSRTRQWASVICDTYGHSSYRITSSIGHENGSLELVEMKNIFFGHSLVSMPFCDVGGFNCNNIDIEKALFNKALDIMKNTNADILELRMDRPLKWLHETNNNLIELNTHKVRLLLDLPDTTRELEDSFKSKLRSQIKRPIKEGMCYRFGKNELLHDFYRVFSENMKNLGSPVHSKKLFYNIFSDFVDCASIVMVYTKKKEPVAGGVLIGKGRFLSNPWASSLREYRSSSPNMLLYWAMLKFAILNGYKKFDFGRSNPGEGTYMFKKQWGSHEEQLYWYNVFNKERGKKTKTGVTFDSRPLIERMWKKLPLFLANHIGPEIRGHISL